MDIRRLSIISWSQFIKISKFCYQLNIKPQAVSNSLKYNSSSLSDKQKQLLYDTILNYFKNQDIN